MKMTSRVADYEALVAALRDWGIHFLAPSDAKPGPSPIPPAELIARLAEHTHPRLRMALVPLFILHPELSETLPSLNLSPSAQMILRKNYTAAACLQRMWSIRLSFYLGVKELLPDLYSAELDLAPIDQLYGKVCLYDLAEREEFNQLSAYEGVMDLLFAQLKLKVQNEPTPTG